MKPEYLKREMMIKINLQSIHGKPGVLFEKTHLFSVLSLSGPEHHTSLLFVAAKHLTHLLLTPSQFI